MASGISVSPQRCVPRGLPCLRSAATVQEAPSLSGGRLSTAPSRLGWSVGMVKDDGVLVVLDVIVALGVRMVVVDMRY